ncbi:pkd2, partial [Symbiodinium sp. KB8]
IPPSGGVLLSYKFETVRLYTYFESSNAFWRVWEFLVVIFYVFYATMEVVKGVRFGWRRFLKASIILDNLNIVIYMIVWAFRFAARAATPDAASVVVDSDVYYDFYVAALWKSTSVMLNGINAFLCWFRLVRYLAHLPELALVIGTLERSARRLASFGVIFVVVFYGFAAAHMMTFGFKLKEFRNLTASGFTLIESLLGEFDLFSMYEAQWLMGPLFFVMFIALAVLVVLNILIDIISDAYQAQNEFQ